MTWNHGGIVVRILHHVHQLHDVFIFVPMRLFGEKAAWVYLAHDIVHLNLFYMMIGLIQYTSLETDIMYLMYMM